MRGKRLRPGLALLCLGLSGISLVGAQGTAPSGMLRTQSFDRDPGWEGNNNRATTPPPRPVRQEFGYLHKGLTTPPRKVGGFITPAAESAWYGLKIDEKTLEQPLSAEGTFVVGPGGTIADGAGNTLVGFFHDKTLKEWRTPNTLAFRVNGRGKGFHLHVEYCTAKWRAGGDFFAEPAAPGAKRQMRLVPSGDVVHRWELRYDPAGAGGQGAITATLDGESFTMPLDPGHKADGARFNRFGLVNVMKSADQGGTLWVQNLKVNGKDVPLEGHGGWAGEGHDRSFESLNVRPRFNFGYSATRFAGGKSSGEIGGLIFRGDQRYPERLACYGDRLETLNLEAPLHASGKVTLSRGVTDSTILFGFYHSKDSMKVGPEQSSGIPENFLGATVEGPSREGFLFYPSVGFDREGQGKSPRFDPLPPHIYPDGASHTWSVDYDPKGGAAGRVTVQLDGKSTMVDLTREERSIRARFDRFGFVTTHIDGNGQVVYLDDLTYTWRQR